MSSQYIMRLTGPILKTLIYHKPRLFHLDLYNSKVENTKFIRASVIKSIFPQEINADFSGSTLPATQFHGDLSNVIFSCHEFWCTDFSTKLSGGNLISGTELSYTDLSKRDLSKMVFSNISGTVIESNCGYQCLQYREFFTTKLNFSNLSKSIFKGNNLVNVDFMGADLTFSDLSDTNMSHANLTGANLSGANLSGANLSGANLSGANLSGANLENTNLKGAVLDNAVLSNANLNCKNHPICLND
uniref:Putative Pentapeptide repeats (8 copies) n=1 Tax=uncultured marine crenarchaeote HF4000_APKG5N21 TaxID=455593 RepID=B3T8M0_9ARCH|nr:putative Pentapeptide repeats (8 copies) [uncultured marine crenarchaeote HF4000_APKG5N21]